MKRINKLLFIDVLLVALSLWLAFLLRFDFGMDVAYKEYTQFVLMSLVPFIVISVIFNHVFSLYNSVWRYASIEELLSIVFSVTISNVVFIVYSYFVNYKILHTSYFRFPLTVHIIAWIISIAFLGGTRFIFRISCTANQLLEGTNGKKRLLIIGAGEAAVMLIKEIKSHKELNYNIIGLIDDGQLKIGKKIKGIKVLGDRTCIEQICHKYSIHHIIVAIPSADNRIKREIYNICKNTKCKLKTLPGIFEIIDNKIEIGKIRDVNIEDLLGREEVHLNTEGISEYVKD